MTVQFGEKEVTYTDMVNRIKAMWKEQGKREVSMKSLELYVKPEESKVYYVINSQDKNRLSERLIINLQCRAAHRSQRWAVLGFILFIDKIY